MKIFFQSCALWLTVVWRLAGLSWRYLVQSTQSSSLSARLETELSGLSLPVVLWLESQCWLTGEDQTLNQITLISHHYISAGWYSGTGSVCCPSWSCECWVVQTPLSPLPSPPAPVWPERRVSVWIYLCHSKDWYRALVSVYGMMQYHWCTSHWY